MTKDAIKQALLRARTEGSPATMAKAIGATPADRTFRRALAEMVEEGKLIAEGETRSRTYRRVRTAREEAGLTAPSGYTDSEKFAPLAARAAAGGRTIGARQKDKS